MDADRLASTLSPVIGPLQAPPMPPAPRMTPAAYTPGDDAVKNDFLAARSAAAAPNPSRELERLAALTPEAAAPGAVEGAAGAAANAPPPEEPLTEPLGWRLLKGAGNVAKDVGLGVVDAPRQVAGGLLDYGNHLMKFADKVVKKAEDAGLPNAYFRLFDKDGGWSPKIMSADQFRAAQEEGRDDVFQVPTTGKPETITGNIVRTGTEFLVGRGTIAAGGGKAMNALADFVSGATAVDPDQPRLSNVIDQVAPNFLTSWLKAKPEDEGTLLGNLKNGLEMAGLGQVVNQVVRGVKAIKAAVTAHPQLGPELEAAGAGGAPATTAGAEEGGAAAAAESSTAAQTAVEGAPQGGAKGSGGALGDIMDMESDLPWKTQGGAPGAAGGVDETASAAAQAAKAAGGVGAAPDQQAQRVLALGNPAEPAVQPAPKFEPDVEAHAAAAEEFTAGKAEVPSIDEYLAGRAANPLKVNLARIGSPEDIQEALARVSATIPKQEVQSNAATVAASDALGLTPEDFLAGYRGQQLDAAQTTAMRFMLDSSASQLVDYAKAAADPAAAPEAKALFLRAFATHRAMQQYFENARAEAGRTLQAWSILSQQRSGASKAIADIIEQSGAGNIDTMAGRIADLADPVKIGRLVSASMKDSGRDNFMKYFYNVLLSNPRTVVKKLTSDSLMGMWNLATRYAAETFGSNIPQGETAQLAYGYASSFRDGVRAAGEALAKGESQFFARYQSMDALHSTRMDLLSDAAPAAYENGEPTRAAMDYLRSALPTSWIGAADDFAKTVNYRAELRALAYRDVTSKGLDGEDLETAMAQTMDNVPLSLHKQAVAAALRNTFQEPLGPLGSKIQELADGINLPLPGTSFELPLGRILMPFVRVPLNIAKWSYTNGPLALAFPSSAIRQELSSGGAARDLAVAKIGLGTGVAMAASGLALNNVITGRGPSDPQLARAWRAAGNEPYSIKVGDKWYGYNSVEPMGLMLGAIADTFMIARFAKEQDRGDLAASLAFGVGNAMLSKTYLQGVAEFFKTLEEPDDHTAGYVDRLLAPFLVPQGVAAAARAIDPFQRTHYDLLDTVESRLPYLSQGLPPQRTLWGDPVPVKDGFLPFMTGTAAAQMLSPVQVKSDEAEPIDRWIFDHRMDFPRGPDNKLGLTKPGIIQNFSAGNRVSVQLELTPQQHDRLQVLAGNEIKDPASGLGAKDTLNALVEGHGPANLQRQWDSAPPAAQALIVQTVVNKFRAAAKQQLIGEYPDIQEALSTGFAARAQALSGPQPQPVAR